jgi:hypothetical protein
VVAAAEEEEEEHTVAVGEEREARVADPGRADCGPNGDAEDDPNRTRGGAALVLWNGSLIAVAEAEVGVAVVAVVGGVVVAVIVVAHGDFCSISCSFFAGPLRMGCACAGAGEE